MYLCPQQKWQYQKKDEHFLKMYLQTASPTNLEFNDFWTQPLQTEINRQWICSWSATLLLGLSKENQSQTIDLQNV